MSKPPTPNLNAPKPNFKQSKPEDSKPKPEEKVPEQVIPEAKPQQNVQLETEGFGRFEYSNGTIYEGHWKIIGNNIKVKHGEGTLTHAGTTAHEKGNEEYRGNWVEDRMEGTGVYKYTSGAIYSGEWKDGKHHGRVTIRVYFRGFITTEIRGFMNFLMVASMTGSGKTTECTVRGVSSIRRGTDGTVFIGEVLCSNSFGKGSSLRASSNPKFRRF